MNINKKVILTAVFLMQTFSAYSSAASSSGIILAAAQNASQGLSLTATQPKCIKSVAGTKWKGKLNFKSGVSVDTTVTFNAGGKASEPYTVSPTTWTQSGKTVKWITSIVDAKVHKTAQLKCNKMYGTFKMYDIGGGPSYNQGTIKMFLLK